MNTYLSSLSTIAAINKLLEDCGADFHVKYQRLFRNGVRDAYVLKPNDSRNPASQIAYIDDLLSSDINDIPSIANYLIDTYQPIPPSVLAEGFTKTDMMPHILPRLYSARHKHEMDAAGICSIPCTSAYLVAFYFSFATVPEATVTITDKIMGQLDITLDELWTAAKKNAMENFWFSDLTDVIDDEPGDEEYGNLDESQHLYILTNQQQNLGSGLIAFTEIQERIYRELGNNDYYIFPSSIHELIIVRHDIGMTLTQMEALVKQVNRDAVENVNLLGSQILMYRHGFGIDTVQ